MKKKIQKYLAGEREGFSLVELIIVIAIMAILIGVIALAVIPNIQRSRESKDLTTLDNVLSSTNIAIANNKVSGAGGFTISGATYTQSNSSDTNEGKVMNAVKAELGSVELGSSAGAPSGYKICVSWTAASPSAAAKITVKSASALTADAYGCQYTSDPTKFEVTN